MLIMLICSFLQKQRLESTEEEKCTIIEEFQVELKGSEEVLKREQQKNLEIRQQVLA